MDVYKNYVSQEQYSGIHRHVVVATSLFGSTHAFIQASVHQDEACEVHDLIADHGEAYRKFVSCCHFVRFA